MKRLPRPTLTRRVILALVLAFAAVWSILLAFEYAAFKQGMRSNSGLHQLSGALSVALADVDDPQQARSVVAATASMTNHLRRAGGQLPGEVLFEVRERHGRVLYRAPALATHPLGGALDHVSAEPIAGRRFWVIRRDTARWTLRVAEPAVGDTTVLGWLSRELLPYLLLAFPIVLVVLWLAVRSGLRPLRELTGRIDARPPDDLSPIGQPPRYAELQPLVVAFDRLLGRLRHQVQRERAFVQDAAHELRTPLAVVAAQAHVIARATEADTRQRAQGHLDDAIARSSQVIGQLLELAALDEMQPAAPTSVDVASHVRNLLAQKAGPAAARDIDLSLEAPDSLRWQLDMPAFESIMHNLLDNALRHVHEGCRIVVVLEVSAGTLTVSVADDGPGIAEDQRDLVFQRFYRLGGSTAPGSGLGLAIVRQAAWRMGGTVSIADGLDQRGCAFHVRFGSQ